jgi:hypothetical protein
LVGSRDQRTQFWKGAIQESFQGYLDAIGKNGIESKYQFAKLLSLLMISRFMQVFYFIFYGTIYLTITIIYRFLDNSKFISLIYTNYPPFLHRKLVGV